MPAAPADHSHTVLRERYLRSDIPCGYEGCDECVDYPGFRRVLPARGFTGHTDPAWGKHSAGHWLVVDTNVVLHQVGLLCSTGLALAYPVCNALRSTSCSRYPPASRS